jgi:hypothetical protein
MVSYIECCAWWWNGLDGKGKRGSVVGGGSGGNIIGVEVVDGHGGSWAKDSHPMRYCRRTVL